MLLLIPLLPFAGFVVNAFFGKRLPKAVSGGVACLVMLASFVVSVAAAWPLMGHGGHPVEQVIYTWLGSGDLQVPFVGHLHHLQIDLDAVGVVAQAVQRRNVLRRPAGHVCHSRRGISRQPGKAMPLSKLRA